MGVVLEQRMGVVVVVEVGMVRSTLMERIQSKDFGRISKNEMRNGISTKQHHYDKMEKIAKYTI